LVRILFIGDIVGKPGRKTVKTFLREIIDAESIDLVIANGENAAGGFGITVEVCEELYEAGIDVITLGNHTWDNREAEKALEQFDSLVRPANYPEGTPGVAYYLAESSKGVLVGVVNLLGQVFMEPMACPFRTADFYINQLRRKTNIIVIDLHAEATSEKAALGWYLDGKVTAVLGTHTHVATADEQILPNGTAYITDIGMTGPIDSVLGIKPELIIQKFLTKRPVRFELAAGPAQFNGVIVEAAESGLATEIKRINRRLT